MNELRFDDQANYRKIVAPNYRDEPTREKIWGEKIIFTYWALNRLKHAFDGIWYNPINQAKREFPIKLIEYSTQRCWKLNKCSERHGVGNYGVIKVISKTNTSTLLSWTKLDECLNFACHLHLFQWITIRHLVYTERFLKNRRNKYVEHQPKFVGPFNAKTSKTAADHRRSGGKVETSQDWTWSYKQI